MGWEAFSIIVPGPTFYLLVLFLNEGVKFSIHIDFVKSKQNLTVSKIYTYVDI